jgi:hypothetical protein
MRGKTHHHRPSPWYTSGIPPLFTTWPIHSELTARTSRQGGKLNPKRPPPGVTAVNRRQPRDTCLKKLIEVRFFKLTSCGLDPKLVSWPRESRQPLFDIPACKGTHPSTHKRGGVWRLRRLTAVTRVLHSPQVSTLNRLSFHFPHLLK